MQIHELTTKQLNEGPLDFAQNVAGKIGAGVAAVRGAGQGVSNAVSGVTTAYQQAQMGQKYTAMADKAQKAWTVFATQLEKSITDPAQKAAFINRTDGRYQQTLQAWVEKNLLAGHYLPNFTNKDQLLAIIKKLSAPKAPYASTTTGTSVAAPTPQQQQQQAQLKAQLQNKQGLKATGTPPPPANQFTPAQVSRQQRKAAAGATKIKTNPTFESLQLNEVLDPATEKQLFTQLIQTAATGLTSGSQSTTAAKAQAGQQPAGQQPAAKQSKPVAQSKEAAQQIIINQTGLPPETLAAIEAITGALPAVTSKDAQTINYLQALGFNVQ